jgi:CHC2 zinc finger
MNFPAELVEAVRATNPIEDVVSERVQLRRSGAQLTGRCPLHADKTPSFYVHLNKQVFRCHGCQAGGDVFEFVRLLHHCSFPDAVKILAIRAGVRVEGFRPSSELKAKVAAAQARRAEEVAFERWRDGEVWATTNMYRRLGEAALHAEDYLRAHRDDAETDPVIHEMAWAALQRYTAFGERIEREGLLDVAILRSEWQWRRGERHVAA